MHLWSEVLHKDLALSKIKSVIFPQNRLAMVSYFKTSQFSSVAQVIYVITLYRFVCHCHFVCVDVLLSLYAVLSTE